jgi:predicted nucleotidyltransferase
MLEAIDRFARAVVEHFQPERIVLFGSQAHDAAEPGSDVDLLVVFPGQRRAAHRSLEIRKKLPPDFPLDLLTLSAREVDRRLERNDPFLCEILKTGKTLYESSHT